MILFSNFLFAQSTGILKGKLIDSLGKQSLKNASISLLDAKDSSVETANLAKEDGSFEIKNIVFGRYILELSFQGYETQFSTVQFSKNNNNINLGILYLKQSSKQLPTVIVRQSAIQIKKDTVEFNVSNFKVKPNAVAEDLLKKLPGMEVTKDGSIKSQGETVQRVLVDGKRYFSNDPKLATKNLPPDIIDKIQVFDDVSDQSKFTGFDDGNRIKTINITTKKDKRKGYFGKAVVGIGNDGNDDESFNLHRFNGIQQLAILGQANNINKQNFTQQDILGTSGGRGANPSGMGNGITTTLAGGTNYRDNWNKKTEVYGSYFYNNQNTVTHQLSAIQSLVTADSSTFTNSVQSNNRKNENHRFNFNVEETIDTNNTIIFRPNFSYQKTNFSSKKIIVYTGGKNNIPIYNTANILQQYNEGINGQADFLFRHKFSKKFRTFSFALNVSNNTNNGNGQNYTTKNYFTPTSFDTLNQHILTSATGLSFSPTLSFTEPLSNHEIIELNYNYSYTKNTSQQYTYSFNNATKSYDKFDSIFSNVFDNTYQSNKLTLSYRLQNIKYNFSIGSGVQFGELKSDNTTKLTHVVQPYTNFTPTINFHYNFTKTKNLRINYSGRTVQPSVSQLQPLITTNDSINFYRGNTNLQQQFTHSLRILFTNFNVTNQHVLFATINASIIKNDIQNLVVYLQSPPNKKGATLTSPINLAGTFNVNGYFNYGIPLNNPKSNLNFSSNISYNQSQNLVNMMSNFTKNTALGETIKWTTNFKNTFDINLSATSTYNIARYTLQPTQNANYFSQIVSADFTYYNKFGWIIASDFDYTYNGNRSAGYNASVPLWTPSLAKQLFKNKAGEFRFTIFDLLNQNTNTARTISGNTILDSKTNVLTRYFMLTFTYNLRSFAGVQQKMPGMFKGMRQPHEDGNFNRAFGGEYKKNN